MTSLAWKQQKSTYLVETIVIYWLPHMLQRLLINLFNFSLSLPETPSKSTENFNTKNRRLFPFNSRCFAIILPHFTLYNYFLDSLLTGEQFVVNWIFINKNFVVWLFSLLHWFFNPLNSFSSSAFSSCMCWNFEVVVLLSLSLYYWLIQIVFYK